MLWIGWCAVALGNEGAAWNFEPLALRAGTRLSAGHRWQFDGLLGPSFGIDTEQTKFTSAFDWSGTKTALTARALGGTAALIARVGLQKTPSRATLAGGLGGSAAFVWFKGSDGNAIETDTQHVEELYLWFGPGAQGRLWERWSLGLDLELINLSAGNAKSKGFFQGYPFDNSVHSVVLSAPGGVHLLITRYPHRQE